MYEQDIWCEISKVSFEIPHKDILPIHWKIWFLYNIEILRALRFKSSNAFLKCPPGDHFTKNSSIMIQI